METKGRVSKQNPANIRLDEDVQKASWRRLEDFFSVTFFCCKTSLEEVLQTRLEDVLEDKKLLRWRRLGKQEMFGGKLLKGCHQDENVTVLVMFTVLF